MGLEIENAENVTKESSVVTARDPRRKCSQSVRSVMRRKFGYKRRFGVGKHT